MWKSFKNQQPEDGDLVLVLDTETGEMGVMIYSTFENCDGEEYEWLKEGGPVLGLAGFCEEWGGDIQVTEDMLWMISPYPSSQEMNSV